MFEKRELVVSHSSNCCLLSALRRRQVEYELIMPYDNHFDVLVIGAGPTGMASAIEAQRAGFSAVMVDKGCLVNSLFNYPANMTFFTTPEVMPSGSTILAKLSALPTQAMSTPRTPSCGTGCELRGISASLPVETGVAHLRSTFVDWSLETRVGQAQGRTRLSGPQEVECSI